MEEVDIGGLNLLRSLRASGNADRLAGWAGARRSAHGVELDLPSVDPESIDLDVERNVLTVKAERKPAYGGKTDTVISERPAGTFSRQLFLADTLETERIEASYEAGVLKLRIPVAEQAKPRKIAIGGGGDRKELGS
ncbi:Hsp20/alpha crystallin family protein [Streptomyces sp. NPDC004059]